MKKKILLPLMLIFIIGNSLFSQDTLKLNKRTGTVEKKQEIRICFYNTGSKNGMNDLLEWIYFWDYYPGDFYSYPYSFGNNNTSYGIGYTFTFGKNALRSNLGFNYSNENNKYTNEYSSDHIEDMNSTIRSFCMSMGYQRNYVFDRCKVYIGLDGKFGVNNSNSKFEYINNSGYPYPYTENESYETLSKEIGGGTLLGIQYYILPNLSLSVETCINALYAEYKTTYTYSDYNSPAESSTSNSNRFNINIKPLSIISANIHL